LEIRGRDHNNWNLFELDGSLNLHSVNVLKSLFKQLKSQDKNVILDFTKIKKVDSTGISCLIYCQRVLAESGSELRIIGLCPSVKIIFQITRGYEIFSIYDDLKFAAENDDSNLKEAA